jgi:hypothetical protein
VNFHAEQIHNIRNTVTYGPYMAVLSFKIM